MSAASPPPAAEPAGGGAWAPFAHGAFALLWTATVVSNIGTWMHDVGAGWLMTELSPSPFVVALVQAATTAPVFLFALIAGAVADIVDRRRLLLGVNLFMGAVAALLALCAALELMTPALLILFTFLLGTGAAFLAPAWQAIVPQLVPRGELSAAIALNSMGVNVSRAIGPALAGFLIVWIGHAAPFAVNALSFLGILAALYWWKAPPRPVSTLPPESVGGAVRTGLAYAFASRPLRATKIRAGAFFACASAYWAMLPLIARETLQGGPTLYGAMLTSVGVGAVLGAVLLPSIRRRLDPNRLVAAGSLGTALVLLLFAVAADPIVAVAASALGGLCWIAVLSSLHVSAQLALPDWVRARGLSIFLTVFFGAMSGGSLLWGALADAAGVGTALLTAAAGAALLVPLTWGAKLNQGEAMDLAPSAHWPEPTLSHEDPRDRGPVMIQVAYEVAPEQRSRFRALMAELAGSRRRGGGRNWTLMEDAAAPGSFVETWFEASWLEHQRHHAHVSREDEKLQAEIRGALRAGAAPLVRHFLDAR